MVIHGGERLIGEVQIGGAKNAALPLFIAALLTDEEIHLHNVPALRDIDTVEKLLRNNLE